MSDIAPNTFKAALAAGKVQLGIWSSLCSPLVAEILADSGFDWILFDAEHSPVEISGLLPLLQAAAHGKPSCAVRPPWNDPVLLKRVLDIGAGTVLIPFVESADEAAAAVTACRFPPDGTRGVAVSTRASRFGRAPGYLRGANAEICVLVQAETANALSNLGDIAAVDGIDGVFIGPSDLAASMGHIGNPGHQEVQEAIRSAAARIRRAGKAPGILAASPQDARRYLDWGFLFVACGSDIRFVSDGVHALHDALATKDR